MLDNADRSIVLTGATGFLGAFLMAGLLEQGHRMIVLGRASKDTSIAERLSELCNWFSIEPCDRLVSLETDFSSKQLGLDEDKYRWLCANAGKIIHCASDTSFSELNRTRVMETNVHNISALLEFAADTNIEKLYYVSSAYASGVYDGICMETPVTNSNFTNVYEESKAMAENIILNTCEGTGVPLVILRPSIVFGHSKTGAALKFNALYYAVKSLMLIRDIFIKDIRERGGERSKKWGLNMDKNGVLKMPLDICLPNRGFVNLIPVDYFVEASLRIIEDSGSEGIYHITSDNPPVITTLAEYAERYLNIRGIRLILNPLDRKAEQNPAEELFEKFITQYRPYLSDPRSFDRSRINKITPGLVPSLFTYDIFKRCMDYALDNNWRRNT
jgi:nucleoside-diphosphate-sugar epimerase